MPFLIGGLLDDHKFQINNDSLDLYKLKSLYANCNDKMYNDAKMYIIQYIFPLKDGDYLINEEGTLTIIPPDILSRTILNKVPTEIRNWFKCEYYNLFSQVCIPNQQFLLNNKINIFGKYKHTNDMKYADCDKKQKQGCKIMLDFFKEIWCDDNKDSYEYVLNWLSELIKGHKNQTVLFLKSITEGIGKSSGTSFIMDYVLGNEICIESNSEPLKTKYNHTLFGKLLVVFEELENTTLREWSNMSKALKTMTTSNKLMYEDKYMRSFKSNNINNYIINSNNDCIKNSEGRRYYICDLNTKRKGDYDYWNMLNDKCMNDEVGKCFYLYLLERDTSNFNSSVFKLTKSKTDAITDRLNNAYKFLKFNYILSNKSLKNTTKTLYEEYKYYCSKVGYNKLTKRNFISALREVNIRYSSRNSKCVYDVQLDDLKNIASIGHWYSVYDSEELSDNVIWRDGYTNVNVLEPTEEDINIVINGAP